MQRIKRIGLLILTNLMIMIGIYIILFVLERYFGFSLGSGYTSLLFYAAIFGFGGSLVSLRTSRWMAKRMYNIQIIDLSSGKSYDHKIQVMVQTIQNIVNQKGLPMPEIGVYESAEPNAFATGPSKSSALVAASTGLLSGMTDEEISGVIAHEMSHIMNGDMVTMTLLQGIMNTFVFFLSRVVAGFGSSRDDGKSGYNPLVAIACEIVFGILGSIIVNQFSQHREYKADEGSAKLLGKNPMIAALERLKVIAQGIEVPQDELATMKIFGGGRGLTRLFATHPSLESRIERLKAMDK